MHYPIALAEGKISISLLFFSGSGRIQHRLEREIEIFCTGLAAGLFWCLAGAAGGALHVVLLALSGAVVGYVCDRYLRRNLLSALLMSLGCLIFCQGVLFLAQVFLGHVGFGAGLLPVLRQIGLSLLAAPPVYLAAWLIRKAGA